MVVGGSLFDSCGARRRHCSNQTRGFGGVCPERFPDCHCVQSLMLLAFALPSGYLDTQCCGSGWASPRALARWCLWGIPYVHSVWSVLGAWTCFVFPVRMATRLCDFAWRVDVPSCSLGRASEYDLWLCCGGEAPSWCFNACVGGGPCLCSRRALVSQLTRCNVVVSLVTPSFVGGRLGDLHLVDCCRVQARTMRHSDVESTALFLTGAAHAATAAQRSWRLL